MKGLLRDSCAWMPPHVGTHRPHVEALPIMCEHPAASQDVETMAATLTLWEDALTASIFQSCAQESPATPFVAAVPNIEALCRGLATRAIPESPNFLNEAAPRCTFASTRAELATTYLLHHGHTEEMRIKVLAIVRSAEDLPPSFLCLRAQHLSPLQMEDATLARCYVVLTATLWRANKVLMCEKLVNFAQRLVLNKVFPAAAVVFQQILLALVETCLPRTDGLPSHCVVSPTFIALAQSKLIEMAAAMRREDDDSAVLLRKNCVMDMQVLVHALVDLYTTIMRTWLLSGVVALEDCETLFSGAFTLSPNARWLTVEQYDCVFGSLLPALLQQLGFEWPWDGWRQHVQLLKKKVPLGNTNVLLQREERMWSDLFAALGKRTYFDRVANLNFSQEQLTLLRMAFPVELEDRNVDQLLKLCCSSQDLFKVAEESRTRWATHSVESRANAMATTLRALNSTDLLTQLAAVGSVEAKAQLSLTRMAYFVHCFFHSTGGFQVVSRCKSFFLDVFGRKLDELRRECLVALSGREEESPFAIFLQNVADSIISVKIGGKPGDFRSTSPQATDDVIKSAVAIFAGTADRTLEVMIACYLPLRTAVNSLGGGGGYSVGFHITPEDLSAVVITSARVLQLLQGVSASVQWESMPMLLRKHCRSVAGRLSMLSHREDIAAHEKNVIRAQRDQWSDFLASLAAPAEAAAGPPHGLFQVTMASHFDATKGTKRERSNSR